MKESNFTLTAPDGAQIFVYKWLPDDGAVKAVVQIAHGMAEHAGRYARFAEYLTQAGYAVYANDHRGHGKTAGDLENVGYFADSNGWSLVVNDMHSLSEAIKKEQPRKPLFLFGHSMGSFLSRHYAFLYGSGLHGLILSGTGGDPGLLGKVGVLVANLESTLRGKRHRSGLLNTMSFGSFNKAFKPNRTEFDWLGRDEAEVDKYIADPYCGGVFTSGFFADLLAGLGAINNAANIAQTPDGLPIYLFAGDRDPVGDFGKGVRQVYGAYQKAGIKDLQMKLYPNGRHEMLNETNRREVFADVLAWLDGRLG